MKIEKMLMQYVSSKKGPKQYNLSNAGIHTKVDDQLMVLAHIEASVGFIMILFTRVLTLLQQNYNERISHVVTAKL